MAEYIMIEVADETGVFADVRKPLIRCRDCIHRTHQFGKDHYCRIVSNVMPDNGFCSMAERSSDVRNQDA